MSTSPLAAAISRHRLSGVARRTGIYLATDTGPVTVRCPLPSHGHPDRSPSMRLFLNDDHYYCFGCGAKGDVVQWVRDAEDASLSEALRLLDSGGRIANAWAGHTTTGRNTLPAASGKPAIADLGGPVGHAEIPDLGRTPADRVCAALLAAWSYYSYRSLHSRGVAYLAKRAIDVGVLESHTGRAEVGHTPARSDGLVAALQAHGFTHDELVDAGLAYRRVGSDRVSDFYRERVVIPLRDGRGGVCGFIGRNVGDARWPKYKNPPRTHAYNKSVNLYQPLPALTDPRGRVVVVEGTLDALAIAAATLKTGRSESFCPVTQSGRELSDLQIRRIIGLHPKPPVIAFDSDTAGRDSAFRYALAFARMGSAAMVTDLGNGHDPASWIALHGPTGLSAWSPDQQLGNHWTASVPIAAATFAALHIASQGAERTELMKALTEIARMERALPGRARQEWVEQVAAVAGRVAVAEAHARALANTRHCAPAETQVNLAEWRPEPVPEIDVGFEAAVGTGETEAFIERIAIWGQRLPCPGDLVFIRSASVTLNAAGILPTAKAQGRLERALGRLQCSVDPPEVATPLLTTKTIGL